MSWIKVGNRVINEDHITDIAKYPNGKVILYFGSLKPDGDQQDIGFSGKEAEAVFAHFAAKAADLNLTSRDDTV